MYLQAKIVSVQRAKGRALICIRSDSPNGISSDFEAYVALNECLITNPNNDFRNQWGKKGDPCYLYCELINGIPGTMYRYILVTLMDADFNQNIIKISVTVDQITSNNPGLEILKIYEKA